jgi:lysyl-tRNA synthetase class 2
MSPWWNPDRHADRRPALLLRGRIKAAVRAWFEAEGFVEVETSSLQASPGGEVHLHAFETALIGPALETRSVYLHTSPEFALKKLLAAGETSVFTFAPVFRNRERSALHHPEFTMLEWYRAGAGYEAVMADAASILKLAAEIADNRFFSFRGRTGNPRAEPERLTVAEAMSRYAGIDLLSTLGADGPDRELFAALAEAQGLTVRADDTWSDIFAKVLTARVEPQLGTGHATLLIEYPAVEASLARIKSTDPRVAERFELYCCGVELANGYSELTDPAPLRARLTAHMDERERIHGTRYPLDEDLLAASAHIPPAAGCALGFDRLVMLAAGAHSVEQVIWTPVVE